MDETNNDTVDYSNHKAIAVQLLSFNPIYGHHHTQIWMKQTAFTRKLSLIRSNRFGGVIGNKQTQKDTNFSTLEV